MRAFCIRVGPQSKDECPYRRQKREDRKDRAKGHVKMEVDTGVMRLQAKNRHGFLTATRSWERGMEWILSEVPAGTSPTDTLISNF